MKKRLRKKKHLGEYREWGCEIAVTRNRKDGFDEFLDAFIGTVELAGCLCGGGGEKNKLHMFVKLGRIAADPERKLQKIIEWLKSRSDVANWQTGKILDVWHDSVDPYAKFPVTSIQEVAACLPLTGKAKTLEEMEDAIKAGATKKAQ